MKDRLNDHVMRVHAAPAEIAAEPWNALLALQAEPTPFMRHEYLSALHESGSATPATGWTPCFLALWRGDTLEAACPLYLKEHSYGEYVFDWAWANAYQQHGLAYYPKALVAVPFTPVPGTRLLARDAAARAALVRGLVAFCRRQGLSSVHLLFGADDDIAACAEAGLMLRHTVQFHWKNVAPTLPTACGSLPPEGAAPAFGRPGGGGVAPTLPTACGSLPPEGAAPAFGRPGGGGVAPTLPTACGSLPPEGAAPAFGRPGGGGVAPTLPTACGSLPPEGAAPAFGRPGGGGVAPTLPTACGSLPPEGAAPAFGRPGGGGGPTLPGACGSLLPEEAAAPLGQAGNEARPWGDFETFLGSLSHDKRKKIRQERRKVAEAGVRFRWSRGAGIAPADWDFFYRCYARTYREHGNAPYLTRDFFRRMAETLPEAWLLFVAERAGRPIATSLIALSLDGASAGGVFDAKVAPRAAYGRYWGAVERVDCLHFEACYYQPLAWCIAHGVARFEGGAQGEHKMARALMPVKTTSAHWLAHPAFADAVERFLEREDAGIERYVEHLDARSPFRHSS